MAGIHTSHLRHLDIFDPDAFWQICHIVGAGAVGSRIAESLVRLGVKKLELYDDDAVQGHNIPAGVFTGHLGTAKVLALKQQFSSFDEVEIIAHCRKVTTNEKFTGVVFLCVDSMESRQQIWKNCVKQNPSVSLMIETRIGPREGRIYTVNPLDISHIERWEELSDYSGGYEQELPCTRRSVIATVNIIVGFAINQLICWHNKWDYPNSVSIGLEEKPALLLDYWT